MDPEVRKLLDALNAGFKTFKDASDGKMRDIEAKLTALETARARADIGHITGHITGESLGRPEARAAFRLPARC